MTNSERKILTEMHMNGPITYQICEAIDVDLGTFLDVMGGFKKKGWVDTRYIEVTSDSGRDKEILEYALSERFKNMFEFKLIRG